MINTRKKGLVIPVFAMFLLALFVSAHPARAEIVYTYDFEAGWDNWWADNGIWEVGEPTTGPESAHSPPNCAGTVLDGNYPRYTDSRLISPSIDLPEVSVGQEIVLRFWQWFSYYREPNTTDDRGQVQIQTYENDVWSDWSHPLLTSVLYSPVWSTAQVDLTAYAGKRVRVAFHHQDYNAYLGGESTGWYIDDVLIEKRWACLFDTDVTEGFESGWGCWWADNGVWQVGEPTTGPESAHSPPNCAGTVLDGNYPRYTGSRLISPPIDLDQDCDEIYFKFWQWFSYYREPNTTDDGGQVQIQTFENDVWSDWVTLLTVTLSSGDWSPAQVDLTAYAGKRVRVGFHHQDYHAYLGGESTGWYIDDIEIICITPPLPFKIDIKVKGSDGPLTITENDSVSVTVKLEPGDYEGVTADWWLGAATTNGAYWVNSSLIWVKSDTPISVGQWPLFDLPETNFPLGQLDAGIYTIFFVLDDTPDGIFDITARDHVNVFIKKAALVE